MPKTQHNISWPTTWAVPRIRLAASHPSPSLPASSFRRFPNRPRDPSPTHNFALLRTIQPTKIRRMAERSQKNGGIAMAQIGVAASRRERLPAGHPQRSDCTYQFVCHISVSRRKTVAGAQSRTIAHNSTRKSVEKAPRRPTAAMGSPRPKSYKIRCTRE
jgi:hypothetical protein